MASSKCSRQGYLFVSILIPEMDFLTHKGVYHLVFYLMRLLLPERKLRNQGQCWKEAWKVQHVSEVIFVSITRPLVTIYSPTVRTNIGHYTSQHDPAAAAQLFTHKLGHRVCITTVCSIRKAFDEERKKSAVTPTSMDEDEDVTLVPPKKRGKPALFGEEKEER